MHLLYLISQAKHHHHLRSMSNEHHLEIFNNKSNNMMSLILFQFLHQLLMAPPLKHPHLSTMIPLNQKQNIMISNQKVNEMMIMSIRHLQRIPMSLKMRHNMKHNNLQTLIRKPWQMTTYTFLSMPLHHYWLNFFLIKTRAWLHWDNNASFQWQVSLHPKANNTSFTEIYWIRRYLKEWYLAWWRLWMANQDKVIMIKH